MAFWRLRQRHTVPETLGIRLASTDSSIAGDYLKTSQTTTYYNYPVYYCAEKGMYLFVGYAMDETESAYYGNYWALNSSVIQTIGETEWDDPPTFSLLCHAIHPTSDEMAMDPETGSISDDFNLPTSSFLTTTWTKADKSTVSITASMLESPAAPLIDLSGADTNGVLIKTSNSNAYNDGVLCFQRNINGEYGLTFDSLASAYSQWTNSGGAAVDRVAVQVATVNVHDVYPDGNSSPDQFVRWQGQIYIPEERQYGIKYRHARSGFTRIGSTVVGSSNDANTDNVTASLHQGWNQLDIFLYGWGDWANIITMDGKSIDTFRFRCDSAMLKGSSKDYAY